MRRIKAITFIVCILLITNISLTTVSSNDIQNEFKHYNELEVLRDIALIGASDWDPNLNSVIIRQIAIARIISVIGKLEEIYEIERDEVEEILSKYEDNAEVFPGGDAELSMAYAVKEGLVIGTSKTTLSPRMQMNGKMFATIILRHLGYEVTIEEYEQACMILSTKNGISIEDAIELNDKPLIYDDFVGMAFYALEAEYKDGGTIIDRLLEDGIITEEGYELYNSFEEE